MEPTGGYDQNYGILLYDDFFYLHDIDNNLAIEFDVNPLCQYIPERDGKLEIQKKPSGYTPLTKFYGSAPLNKFYGKYETAPWRAAAVSESDD